MKKLLQHIYAMTRKDAIFAFTPCLPNVQTGFFVVRRAILGAANLLIFFPQIAGISPARLAFSCYSSLARPDTGFSLCFWQRAGNR